jgi:hypothetical protein
MAGRSNNFADIITKKPGGKKSMKAMKRNMKRKGSR